MVLWFNDVTIVECFVTKVCLFYVKLISSLIHCADTVSVAKPTLIPGTHIGA